MPKAGYAPLGEGADAGPSDDTQFEMTAPVERTALLPVVRTSEAVELERVSTPPIRAVSERSGRSAPEPAGRRKSTEEESEEESDIEVFQPDHSPGGVHFATMAQKRALWWRNVLVTGMFILTWYTFATLLSMYNKWMFSPELYGFSYPLFVTACHMGVQFICAAIIRYTLSSRFRPAERPTRREYVQRVTPTSLATSADIGLSNLSLKTITLSLYTMCKSSALIFVVLFAFLFHLEKFSLRLLAVICLISLGVFMMVFNTADASIPGIIMVISASAIGGLRWALTELVMSRKSMGLSNPFATIFWLTPLMCVTLLAISAIIEDWHKMFFEDYFFSHFWVAMRSTGVIALPGVLAFSMVASEFFVIQRAGVVPLSIAGIAKEVSTLAFSAWAFGDKLTTLNLIGCVVTILGIALYSFHKYTKSMREDIKLDATDNPIDAEDDETAPLNAQHSRTHSRALSTASTRSFARSTRSARSNRSRHSTHGSLGSPSGVGVPLQDLDASSGRAVTVEEAHEERVARLRDEFEGWDSVTVNSEGESEADDDEVAHRREQKMGGGMRNRWDRFWDASM